MLTTLIQKDLANIVRRSEQFLQNHLGDITIRIDGNDVTIPYSNKRWTVKVERGAIKIVHDRTNDDCSCPHRLTIQSNIDLLALMFYVVVTKDRNISVMGGSNNSSYGGTVMFPITNEEVELVYSCGCWTNSSTPGRVVAYLYIIDWGESNAGE
jgi:hypothetical protein